MKRNRMAVCMVLVVSLVIASTGMAFAQSNVVDLQASGIKKALNYLHSVQNADGGFPSQAGGKSSRALTSWAVMSLCAAGEEATGSAWAPAGKNPLDYLHSCKEPLQETCDYARLLLALMAVGGETTYQGVDIAAKIASFQQPSGQLAQPSLGEEGMINSHMWSVIALASAGFEIPNKDKAKQWLVARQNEDGGFGWAEGIASDADDTGVAVQALVVLGENPQNSPVVKKALDYLKGCQMEDGGFSCGDTWMGSESNVASDAWVLQGLTAAGEDPVGSRWSINVKNGISHLLSLQNSDGSFAWKPGVTSSPVSMTAYALMALAGKPLAVNLYQPAKNAVPAVEGGFSDLSPRYWAYQPIMNLVDMKVLGGYPDRTFRPDQAVSRAEFTKFMTSGLGLEAVKAGEGLSFTDVSSKHWAYAPISVAVQKGYVKGRPGGIFDPSGKITGAELASMLVRALPPEKAALIKEGAYWYSGSVELAETNNLLYPGFKASANATRAQCAYSIVKLRDALGL